MDLAVQLAAKGPAYGPNPRVGAVLTDADGVVLATGYHQGAGTAHAEAAAIADARSRGVDLTGAHAYVTLEPCSHVGRTGACTDALTSAGVAHVTYAVADPNPLARGGADVLASRGVDVHHTPHPQAEALNQRWLASMSAGRPYVIVKWAQTLDGYTAAADRTSFWITGEAARAHAHTMRAQVDAILVGTQTVITDNPLLSARPDGIPDPHQPLRVVMGLRDTSGAQVWRDDNAIALHTHEPDEVLRALWERDIRTLVVEGGSRVITAFLGAGLVDELNVYIAPALLGDGVRAVGGLGITTMADALRATRVHTTSLGADTLVTAHLGSAPLGKE